MAYKKPKPSATRLFHRLVGAGSALFVIFMVLSGLVINHSNGLGFDQQHVNQPFVLSWYGLNEPESIQSFSNGLDWLSFAGSQLYLNDKLVSTVSNGIGAVFSEEMLIAASGDEILLLDRDGSLIERQSWDQAYRGPIDSIGLLGTDLVVKSADKLWRADTQLLDWQAITEKNINPVWSSPQDTPEELSQSINRQYRGDGLSVEHLLLDIHSGHVFGKAGVLVYDLLAILVGLLALSGLVLWWLGRRNGNGNGNGNRNGN